MRITLIAIILLPKLLFAQSNELFKLLKWNSPEQQQRLIVWYDMQDNSTVKLNSNKVYSINDKGLWKNHIIQNEANSQPLLIRDNDFASGEKNGISFANGGYMVYKFKSEKSVKAITSFVVCKNEIGGSKLLFDLSNEGGEGIASCYSGQYKIESRVPNSSAQFEPDFSRNQSRRLLISTKGSAGKIKSYLNDALYSGPGSTIFNGTSYNRIRLSTPNSDAPTDGTLYELILFDYELNDNDFKIVKDFLEKKYNHSFSSSSQTTVKTNLSSKTASTAQPTSKTKPVTKTSQSLRVGDAYKGGIIYELYQDGSGGELFFYTASGIYNNIQDYLKNYYESGIKCYMADDYDLQQLFRLNLIGPNVGDGSWTTLWFMGDRRMRSYTYPYACKGETILNLSDDSNERISTIIKYGYDVDRYKSKCKYAVIGIFSWKK